MRPLSSIDVGVLRALDGVVFDVDDTLTDEGRVTEPAFDALWSLARAGLRLIAVTGRPLGWTDSFASCWPIDAAVGENGAGWAWRQGRALRVGYFDGIERRAVQSQLLLQIRTRIEDELPNAILASDQGARRCDLAYDVGESSAMPQGEVQRLAAIIEAEGARALVSSVHAHAICGEWDKARGAQRAVRDALGEDLAPDRWIFVGDSGNDAAAFAFFPTSVGVANVREHLHRLAVAPAFVTERERGAGFAELAARICEARSG